MKKARNGATTPTEKEKNDAAIKAQKEKRAAIQAASDKRKAEAMEKRKASLRIPASNPATIKAKEEARAKEAEKNKAAIDAQKQKRESIQKDYDRKKEEAMAKRRAAGLPASPAPKTTSPKRNVTYDYMKDADPIRTVEGLKPSSREPEKRKSVGSGGKKKVVRTASAAVPSQKNKKPSLSILKPSAPGIQKGPEKKQYSETESKIAAQIQKIKSGKGSTEAAQAKIKSLQTREKMAKQKAMRKEKRAAVKAVKKSYK